jgi:hypothetical protein
MVTDPTQRRLINRLTLLSIIMGILVGMLLFLAATISARITRNSFLPAHLEAILLALSPIVTGTGFIVSSLVGHLRGRLGLAGPNRSSNLTSVTLIVFLGLYVIGMGLFSLLNTLLGYTLPETAFPIYLLGVLPGCLLTIWFVWHRKQGRAAHP